MNNKYEELEKLQELKENGTISDEEFESEKKKILNNDEIEYFVTKKNGDEKIKLESKITYALVFFIMIAIAVILILLSKGNFKIGNFNRDNNEIENAEKIKKDFVSNLNSENDRKYKDSIKAIQYNSKDTIKNVSNATITNSNLEIKYIENYKGIDIFFINKNNGEKIYYTNGEVGDFRGVIGQLIGGFYDGFYLCYDTFKSNELNTDSMMFYPELDYLKFLLDMSEKNSQKKSQLSEEKEQVVNSNEVVAYNRNGKCKIEVDKNEIKKNIESCLPGFKNKIYTQRSQDVNNYEYYYFKTAVGYNKDRNEYTVFCLYYGYLSAEDKENNIYDKIIVGARDASLIGEVYGVNKANKYYAGTDEEIKIYERAINTYVFLSFGNRKETQYVINDSDPWLSELLKQYN